MANILCAGIAVLDEVFRVSTFPMPDTKVQASEFISIGGGNAANAAVAIARLGGKAYFTAPLGDDAVGNHLIESLQREGVKCVGCVRIRGPARPCRRFSWMRAASAPLRTIGIIVLTTRQWAILICL